jgi:hypothetical protein
MKALASPLLAKQENVQQGSCQMRPQNEGGPGVKFVVRVEDVVRRAGLGYNALVLVGMA